MKKVILYATTDFTVCKCFDSVLAWCFLFLSFFLPEKQYNEAKSKLQEQETEISALRTQQVRKILRKESFNFIKKYN